jgi:putative Holliday junction resolvase
MGMATGRVMALDVGKVRVGVAISDALGYTAQPLLTLWRKSRGEDMRSLVRLIRKHEVVEIVVGNPLHMSGDVSPWALKVQEFAEELHRRSGVPVQLWDERLSTVAAHEILNEAGRDRQNRKHVIDQVAAVVILRGWMEAKEQAAARAALLQSDQSAEPAAADGRGVDDSVKRGQGQAKTQ